MVDRWISGIVGPSWVLAQQQPNPQFLFPLIMILGLLFYLMVLRPENQRRLEQERTAKELKINDRIVTEGGIFGTVVNIQDADVVTIRVDENNNTKLHVRRSSIQRVVKPSDNDKEKSTPS